MKTIDAYWEERNFGVTTQELIIEESDTSEDVLFGVESLTAQYQVVKLPASQIENTGIIENQGFSFIETLISIEIDKTIWGKELPKYKIMSESDQKVLLDHIDSGMFNTDRFSLDQFFPKDKIAGRYKNIVYDEIEKGAALIGVPYNNDIVGFNIIKQIGDSEYFCTLTGIYPPFAGKKLSDLLVGCALSYIEDIGGGKWYGGVATNNLASFRAHMRAGCRPHAITYIFVKHV